MNPSLKTQPSNLQATNPLNDAHKKYGQGYNSFPMSYPCGVTPRYADITPIWYQYVYQGDKQPLRNTHNLVSETMRARLMSGVRAFKDFYFVPLSAILPRNWENYFIQPSQGDDVPDDVGPFIPHFRTFFVRFWNMLYSFMSNEQNSLTRAVQNLLLLELFVSDGSLLSTLNCHLNMFDDRFDVDNFLDGLYDSLFRDLDESDVRLLLPTYGNDPDVVTRVRVLSYSPENTVTEGYQDIVVTNVHALMDLIRSNPDFKFDIGGDALLSDAPMFLDDFFRYPYDEEAGDSLLEWSKLLRNSSVTGNDSESLNIIAPLAYQLSVFEYHTNDKIDNIYSARKFMQMQEYEYVSVVGDVPRFSWNGINILYDVHSSKCLVDMFEHFLTYQNIPTLNGFIYLYNIFCFRQSLKYGDYFTGARPNPLAPGDTDVPVVGDGVSVIDIAEKNQIARWWNAVSRVGRKISNYFREVLGVAPPRPADDMPRFLAREQFWAKANVIVNQADDQGKLVQNVDASGSRYMFEVDIDMPGICIGTISFDAPRFYYRSVDRHFFIETRYDMFNRFMQYVGDQAIKLAERFGYSAGKSQNYAYVIRNMEDKQRYPYCSGGFVRRLPGWLFLGDRTDVDYSTDRISSDQIRNQNSDFNQFFASTTGVSLGTYFHFELISSNMQRPVRKMDYAPELF